MPSKAQKAYEEFHQQTLVAMKTREKSQGESKKHYLSELQIDKLSKFFDVWFDNDHDGVITKKDFVILNDRIWKYTGWSPKSGHARIVADLHNSFWSCMIQAAHRQDYYNEQDKVDREAWLEMWAGLCYGSASMKNFPYWVQLLPAVMFLIIDRDEDGRIEKQELKRFYRDFVGVDAKDLEAFTDVAFDRMTGNGDFELTADLYNMVFANFLLGRSYAGPGKYIFGTFTAAEEKPVQIFYAEDDPVEAVGQARKKSKAHFLLQRVAKASFSDE